MALNRADSVEILKHLQAEMRRRAPELERLVAARAEKVEDPRRYLIVYLGTLSRLISHGSSDAYERTLSLINESVKTSEGGPVEEVRLHFSGVERELLGHESISLADRPNRRVLVSRLIQLIQVLNGEFSDDEAPR